MSLLSDKKVSQELERSWKAKLKDKHLKCERVSSETSVGRRLYNLLVGGFCLGILTLLVARSVEENGELRVSLLSGALFVMAHAAMTLTLGLLAPRDGHLLANTPICESLVKRYTLRPWYKALSIWAVLLVYVIAILSCRSSSPLWLCATAVIVSFLSGVAIALLLRIRLLFIIIAMLVILRFSADSPSIVSFLEYGLPTSWALLLLDNDSTIEMSVLLVAISGVMAVYATCQLLQYVRQWRYSREVFDYDFYYDELAECDYEKIANDEGDIVLNTESTGGCFDRLLNRMLSPNQKILVELYPQGSLTSSMKCVFLFALLAFGLSWLQNNIEINEGIMPIIKWISVASAIFSVCKILPTSLPASCCFRWVFTENLTQLKFPTLAPISMIDLCKIQLKASFVKSIFAIPIGTLLLNYFIKDIGWKESLQMAVFIYLSASVIYLSNLIRYGDSLRMRFLGFSLMGLFSLLVKGVLVYLIINCIALLSHGDIGYIYYISLLGLVILGSLELWLALLDYRNMRLDKVYQEK